MRRREFIAGLGSAAAWPIAARAQQPSMPVIGYLTAGFAAGPAVKSERFAAFHQGLAESGYVEGRTLTIEYRFAEGRNDRLPELAAELVRRQVSVIVTPGSMTATLAAKNATQTIPVVFAIAGDPIAAGFVTSLNRPGGNVTGVTNRTFELITKRVELVHQLAPAAGTIGLLVNPRAAITQTESKEATRVARTLGLRFLVVNASGEGELESSFAYLVKERAGALVVSADNLFVNLQSQVIALAARHSIPTMYEFRDFPAAGGLVSYGSNLLEEFRQVGVYAARILKGEKPTELPVHQATRIELVINLKTAKALGLTIPETLLATADEVIQ